MKHTMIDCYGANEHQLDDMKLINQLLTDAVFNLGLDPICPPMIIPYYYGKVREDIGISAYILLEGGHMTIHTFPIRECYFVDCFTTKDFDENQLVEYLMKVLPYKQDKSFVNTTTRRPGVMDVVPYDASIDFGPHLMAEINRENDITMNDMFDFLENIAYDINMDPITRAQVVKSTLDNPKYLSGIIVIAQSHISLHYEYETKKVYIDIFSCMPFDYSIVCNLVAKLGTIVQQELTARGSKHIYKVKSNAQKDELLANTKWQKVVRKKVE